MRELLSETDSRELSEWLAYDRIEPLPDPYWSSGLIAATMANVWGNGKKKFKPQDFMPAVKVKKRQTPEEMNEKMAALRAWFTAKQKG